MQSNVTPTQANIQYGLWNQQALNQMENTDIQILEIYYCSFISIHQI